ncbi:hypothetical protein BD408DRAFT_353052, partial [Parasitella parasitica]
QQFRKCDLENKDVKLNSVHGNTTDLLKFLDNNIKICVIAIDYAGLTTNMTDLKKLSRDNSSLQKISIDQYFYDNRFKYFDSVQLLNNPEDLKLFNCHPASK